MPSEAEKLEAAISNLETERMRRILDKVAQGRARFDGKLDIRGTPSDKPVELKPYARDGQVDLYHGPMPTFDEEGKLQPRITTVITGVPRGEIDDDGKSEPVSPSAKTTHFPQRYDPVEVRPEEPEPLPISPPIMLRVQLQPPDNSSRNPAGVMVEAVAFVEPNGTLTVRDRATGKPIGTCKVKHGDNFSAAARKVILSQRGPSTFWDRDL